MALIEGRDFIMFSHLYWEVGFGSNIRDIALEVAKTNRVLMVEPPIDRFAYVKRGFKVADMAETPAPYGQIVEVQKNIFVFNPGCILESVNWLPKGPIFDYYNKRNNKLLCDEINRACKELNFNKPIFLADNTVFRTLYVKEFLQLDAYVYYTRDYLMGVDFWKKHGQRIEPLNMAAADVVVANSGYLADLAKPHNPMTFNIGQGCNLEAFNPETISEEPEDMKAIPHPRIGYTGFCTALRLDVKLLEQLAIKNPQWSFVYVGAEDEAFKASSLHQQKNVYFLGSKPMATMPSYINSFDVCMNPQIINDITIGNYPRKIDEYLAMRKPTVATSTKFMEEFFGPYTFLAEGVEGYQEVLAEAVQGISPEKAEEGRAFALDHTWENNVRDIYKAILAFYQQRDGVKGKN